MGEGGMEGEEGKGRRRGGMGCVARGSSGMEADRSAAAPALLDGPLLLLLGVDGRPQISAALSHSHVSGRGQWHRQYLNQLHCSSAIGGALRRRGSYWRLGQALWGEGAQEGRERVWKRGLGENGLEKGLEKRGLETKGFGKKWKEGELLSHNGN